MKKLTLWEQLKDWKENYSWVELSHELNTETPHWVGWEPLKEEVLAKLPDSLFSAAAYTTVGQYGTHVDAPSHMVIGGRTLEKVELYEMVSPLCVIDKSKEATENADYILTAEDIKEWEKENGNIPPNAFVAFRTDWSKRPGAEMDNLDSEGNRHFPGWEYEAVAFLTDERAISAIGHETSDTEAPVTSCTSNYAVEYLILEKNKIQVEMLINLDQCPATGAVIFSTFPRVTKGSGYPARCFAICPKCF